MTSREKPGVAFWATVVVVAALLYPISFEPVENEESAAHDLTNSAVQRSTQSAAM